MIGEDARLDRRALVDRHAVRVQAFSPLASLSLGNGELGLTVDVTGLQSFPEACQTGVPLGLQSQWAWRTAANPEGYELADTFNSYDSCGRTSTYPEVTPDGSAPDPDRFLRAAAWLRENPHRLQLAFFELCRLDGGLQALRPEEVVDVDQRLDLLNGRIVSRYRIGGSRFEVQTAVHPAMDALGFRIRIEGEPAAFCVRLRFPGPSPHFRNAWTFQEPATHTTELAHAAAGEVFRRRFGGDQHHVAVRTSGPPVRAVGSHAFVYPMAGDGLSLVASFAARAPAPPPDFEALWSAAGEHWQGFWRSGMAVAIEADDDDRAAELERRVVLSQFITAAHGAGSMPPQESGLVTNSWHGKFHLEMHLWHAAHFALWGRPELLERSMGWYLASLPEARATAARQGFAGARWPKMVGPDAREAPSDIGVFLVWQQAHPIVFVELLYRADPGAQVLQRYGELVAETASFMADFLTPGSDGRFGFRPPLIPAQETYREQRGQSLNPTFELRQWGWALELAQAWRERAGEARLSRLDEILANLAPPTVVDGAYAAIGVAPHTVRSDHPSMLGALGLLPPGDVIDPAVMSTTLDRVLHDWDWEGTWGWDYPLIAMTAARLGRPEDAVAALLMDTMRNRHLASGHNFLGPPLPTYLPANGGLLYAVALMARGWDGGPAAAAPGFPTSWRVHVEGGVPAP